MFPRSIVGEVPDSDGKDPKMQPRIYFTTLINHVRENLYSDVPRLMTLRTHVFERETDQEECRVEYVQGCQGKADSSGDFW